MKQFSKELARKWYNDFRTSDDTLFESFIFDMIYTYPSSYKQIIDDREARPLPAQVWAFIDYCETVLQMNLRQKKLIK